MKIIIAIPEATNSTTIRTLSFTGHATEQKMSIEWRACSNTEWMIRGDAVSHDKMAYFTPYASTNVYQFDIVKDHWIALPDCPYYNSALCVVNDQLTTIGGSHGQYGDGATNCLVSFTGVGKDRKWVEHFPPMPTSRYWLTAVCRCKTLIAAGGYDDGRILSTVEILDTECLQWTYVSSLPHSMLMASITVCGDKLYLFGGHDQDGSLTLSVFACSIIDLLQRQASLDAQLEQTANQLTGWYQVADTPHYWSTAVGVGEVLLAIGGRSAAGEETSAIVSYDPISNSWQDMGHMTTRRYRPLVALLPSNELIVAGGWGGGTKVEIGKIVA